MPRPAAGGLVYSTDGGGRMCPQCRQPLAQCGCRTAAVAAASASRAGEAGAGVRVSRQTKGRGGKTVTLVSGLPLDDAALAERGKQLRTACGAGGTVRGGVLEVQGDHIEKVLAWLAREGFAAKRSG